MMSTFLPTHRLTRPDPLDQPRRWVCTARASRRTCPTCRKARARRSSRRSPRASSRTRSGEGDEISDAFDVRGRRRRIEEESRTTLLRVTTRGHAITRVLSCALRRYRTRGVPAHSPRSSLSSSPLLDRQSNGSILLSCSVTISRPVARHDEHITFAVPLHVPQKQRVFYTGSIKRPGEGLVQHSAHCKYPEPLQYMQSFFSCSLKF